MSSKRLTVEEVLAAYAATGLKPAKQRFCDENRQACAIGAVVEKAGCHVGHRAYAINHLGYEPNYVSGITKGFDECHLDIESQIKNLETCCDGCKKKAIGVRDGIEIGKAVFNAYPG